MKKSINEKIIAVTGRDNWSTAEVCGLPSLRVSDGPHGLRFVTEEKDGEQIAAESVCYPTLSALGNSFDESLVYTVGQAIAEDCIKHDVAIILGPGVNLKRTPLCGRNFEYFSEDGVLAGKLAAAYIEGVQSKGVGTSLKHFAANNREYDRFFQSSEMDERTLRETYCRAFEIALKAKPWTVMCSYNRINGTYSCENDWLLNKVLRDEWGFEGLVMTDWGAMNNRVKSLNAGLDLEMPDCHGETDKQIVEAVKKGTVSMDTLDKTVERILTAVDKYYFNKKENASYDKEAHHQLARKMAGNSAVLLKNDGILPLKESQKIAIIGEFAEIPRIQGGGSSHINCFRVESALEALKDNSNITYSKGFCSEQDETDEALLKEAVDAAKAAEVAVIFAGLPDSFESEGFDRTHLDMPESQNHLIHEICKVQPNTVVVLHNGSPIRMPWLSEVKGVLEMYLSGQASGAAAADLLYGKVNPSGKLAETFPLRVQDNPTYLNFPGAQNESHYSEGIFIGYRYYDKREMDVLFPFGYGLSYTSFRYSNAKLIVNGQSVSSSATNNAEGSEPNVIPSITAKPQDQILVSVDITNTGDVYGKEVVQLYVKNAACDAIRPEQELRNFTKIGLEPGETKTITLELDERSFSYYNTQIHDWYAPSGDYELLLSASSRDVRQRLTLHLENEQKLPFIVTDITSCGDVYDHANDPSPLDDLMVKSGFIDSADKENDSMGGGTAMMMRAMYNDTPLHSILSFSTDQLTWEDIQETIRAINEKQS